ncbi:hypothetical protein DIPPA_12912 [Diplonema papillatum]|nr:hypothetical protein DIPPA_12912 [Diplonema papillatum]
MADPGFREVAAQVQAQGQQMATLMAAGESIQTEPTGRWRARRCVGRHRWTKQGASTGKGSKKKKKKHNGGWTEVSGKKERKPTAERAMEEVGQRKAEEDGKPVVGARKAKIELRQEDWGVPVVEHTKLAEATVAFAPMASARKIRREGMPELGHGHSGGSGGQ